MNRDIAGAITKTSRVFNDVVWPQIAQSSSLGGGRILSVEERFGDDLAKLLDVTAGIDALQVLPNESLVGVATRVQFVREPFRSFTVRKRRPSGRSTEFDKFKARYPLTNGLIAAKWFIQAYVSPDPHRLLYACWIKCEDIHTCIKLSEDKIPTKTNPEDGVEFGVFWVNDLLGRGYGVYEWAPA